MTELFANFAQGVLGAPITASQTTISITPTDYTGRASGTSNFPSSGNFRIVVQSFDVTTQIPTSAPEIMLVTSVAGNTFTVTRGAESTNAIAFASGATVTQIVTAAVMTALEAGGGGGGSGITRSISSVSSNTNAGSATLTDYIYYCSGIMTLTLPTAIGNTNLYTIKNVGTGTITIATTSGQLIDGASSQNIPVQYLSFTLASDNANWNNL